MSNEATPRGAKPSRMDAMNSISHGRVNDMAENLGLKPEDIISEDPIVEDPPLTGEEDDKLKDKEGEKTKDGEGEVSDDELKAKGKEESPTPKEKEIDDIMDYIDIDQEAEKKYRFKVKIDGEEQVLTADQMKRGYQKDATASKRLEKVSLRAKELDQREEELKRREEELEKRAKQPAAPVVTDDKGGEHLSLEDDVKKFLNAFYGGNEEEAQAALTELLATGRTAPVQQAQEEGATQTKAVDEETVAKMVRDELLWEEARDKFREEYEDVWKDPHLAHMADDFLTEELDVTGSYKEAFTNAGNRVREWMKDKGLAPTPKKDGETTRQEREAKKRQLDTVEDAGTVSDTGLQEEKPQSVSDTIAAMAASRGANRQFRT